MQTFAKDLYVRALEMSWEECGPFLNQAFASNGAPQRFDVQRYSRQSRGGPPEAQASHASFGNARSPQRKLTDKRLFTRFQPFIDTPVQMRPGQAGFSVDFSASAK
jgi:hypothetical protein